MTKTKYNISNSPNRWHPGVKAVDFEPYGNEDYLKGDQQGTLYLQRNNDGTSEFASRAWLLGPRPLVNHANPHVLELTPQNAINVVTLGADPSGRSYSGAIINSAIQKAAARGYGRVYIPAGRYLIEETIIMDSLIWLHGDGMATVLYAKNALNAPLLQAYLEDDVRWGYMQRLSDMRLFGNRDNQVDAAGSVCHGVEWIAPDSVTEPILVDELVSGLSWVQSGNYDGQHFDSNRDAFNLYIQHCAGDGFHMSGRGGGHFQNITCNDNKGNGFRPTYDTGWANCSAGRNGKRGFYINEAAVRLFNCKAWWSGHNMPESGWNDYQSNGFSFENTNSSVAVGCEAQDNYANGFAFISCSGHQAYNCLADSNNKREGDSVGIAFYAAYGCEFSGRAVDRYVNNTRRQATAIKIESSTGNKIRLTHMWYGGTAPASAIQNISHFHADTDSMQGNDIRINFQDGMQKKSGASSPITVSPFHGGTVLVNMTSDLTVNPNTADTLIPDGAKLRFIFRQDNTGGRLVVWNSIFRRVSWSPNLTANKINIIDFVWNSELENWIEVNVNHGV